MAKKDKSGNDLLQQAKDRFAQCQDYFSTDYERGREDLDFAMGISQWPDDIVTARQRSGRPCLTENRMLPFVHQVVNDIRQTRPAVVVNPVDNKADRNVADILQGIIRNIEYSSDANTVYDTAAWNAITTGYGWLRVNTCYADDNSFNKEIKILRVPNFQSVFIDPNAKEIDASDANFAFIFCDMPLDEFKSTYPKAEPVSYKAGDGWASENTVRIAEYFYKKYEEKTICQLQDGSIVSQEEADAMGATVINTRKVSVPVVKWCKLSGQEVLEETDWEGMYIPIVPVYGLEVWLDGKRHAYSLVNQAKDPQRRLNYWLSASTEIIALQPKTPWLMVEGQERGNEDKWETANTDNHAFLTYAPVTMPDGQIFMNAPQRQMPPTGAPAMTQEMMFAADGIKASLGLYNASLGQSGNETSGRAILARQAEGDNATFHFSDNLANAIRQLGRILVDLIPKIMNGEQIARVLGEDGTPSNVPVNQVVIKQGNNYLPVSPNAKGELMKIDLSAGKYDVVCRMGASYGTKRQEAATTLLELAKSDPRVLEVGGDIIFDALDIPYADVLAKRIKKLMPPNILEGDDAQGDEVMRVQQAAQQEVQAMQAQMAQMQAALQQKDDNQQQKMALEQEKMNLEAQKIALEAHKIELDYQIEAAKLAAPQENMKAVAQQLAAIKEELDDVKQATAIQLQIEEERLAEKEDDDKGEKEDDDSEEEKHKGLMPELVSALSGLKMAMEAMNKPKRLVKDKEGNIIGAEPVDTLRGK